MDSDKRWVIPLNEAASVDERLIGGKGAKLAQLTNAGYRVPAGFCITASAYEHFLAASDLTKTIRMELGRKPFEKMRWEEIWDAALRIRSAFLAQEIPADLAEQISEAAGALGSKKPLAVRSSAPGEDASDRSFAGLHESVVGVVGAQAVLEAVRVTWASLWSDAALLYRQELSLDPARSRMAAVVQEVVDEDRSGVAFGRDPRDPALDNAIIEAVPGPCGDLVDGLVDPDRWILDRFSGSVRERRPGDRGDTEHPAPILDTLDLSNVHGLLSGVESLFGWPPDIEWTGRQERLTLLQARPITTAGPPSEDKRNWYLSLRPGRRRLADLAQRVANDLIPELKSLGQRLAAEILEELDDSGLADAIDGRQAVLEKWRQVYLDDFIPFAHGVRQLGTFYNDAVRPEDPYEFVGLLQGERMLATNRNQALQQLADKLRDNLALERALRKAVGGETETWQMLEEAQALPGGETFVRQLEALQTGLMDVSYGGQRLSERADLVIRNVLELARSPERRGPSETERATKEAKPEELEQRLLHAVGPERHEEAQHVLAIGRLSWRLRDDDNMLVGQLESQLLRALEEAARRLVVAGRLDKSGVISPETSSIIAQALRDPQGEAVHLKAETEAERVAAMPEPGTSARQLIGQPAAQGLATGLVRLIQCPDDLGSFQAGEVLVCDAIQPTMTHLVPLACAIVERRGGMLIHGAIIARELGVPCVNGVARATDLLQNGQVVTVDGYLGIVTVGPPEFDLEGV